MESDLDKMLIGVSTSAHQTEGGNKFSDWFYFEQTGRLKHKSEAGTPDSYHHYEDDVRLMANLGFNAYRFSIEMARVMPEEGVIDKAELQHYRDVVNALNKNGIEPVPTLWHWTLPMWFYKKGGFADKENLQHFERYAETVADEVLDGRYVLTLNEPSGYAFSSRLGGFFPPFEHSPYKTAKVMGNLARTHNDLVPILRKKGFEVSFAQNYVLFNGPGPLALPSAIADYVNNLWILDHTESDFIGLNYYRNNNFLPKFRRDKLTDMGWRVNPAGLEKALVRLDKRYGKPILVTENGIATGDDTRRQNFIKEHFDSLLKAKARGVNVLGYLHWSLLDNFEWTFGYTKKFGVAGFDPLTKERRAKDSARVLGDLARSYGSRKPKR